MVFSYVLSWLLDVMLWGLVLAIIADGKQYRIEEKPPLVFALAVGIPTFLEWLAFTFEGVPFLALIWPAFASLI